MRFLIGWESYQAIFNGMSSSLELSTEASSVCNVLFIIFLDL